MSRPQCTLSRGLFRDYFLWCKPQELERLKVKDKVDCEECVRVCTKPSKTMATVIRINEREDKGSWLGKLLCKIGCKGYAGANYDYKSGQCKCSGVFRPGQFGRKL